MMLYHSVGNYGVCLQIGYGTQNFAPRPKDSGPEPSETINPVPGWANRHKQSLAMLGVFLTKAAFRSMKVPKYDLIPNDGIFASV
jgi:hypothetical protein